MSPAPAAFTIAERYDRSLVYAKNKCLTPGVPRPKPTCEWPPENVALLEKYCRWRLSGGASEQTTLAIYMPMAGHVLGLFLRPHDELDLERDFEPAMDYVLAKGIGHHWAKVSHNGLDNFRRFLRQERGLGEEITQKPFDVAEYTQGLPDWLVQELTNYQHIQQRNWRPTRLYGSIRRFWSGHVRIWRFLCEQRGVAVIRDIKRQFVLDYIETRLDGGYAVTGINGDIRSFQAFLGFLHDQGFKVPMVLLRIPTIQEADDLPRFLTDEQVRRLRDDFEEQVRLARKPNQRRDAVLDRAAFYLLWQGGLRLGEVEDLLLGDLDLEARKIMVRQGKGRKDRPVYLTEVVVEALKGYLAMRGMAASDYVFLYRNRPVGQHLIQSRIKAGGKRAKIKVYPHRLRHTMATQLLNAGCRNTSLQVFLGHKRLNTTMVYARVHNHSVADDYYAAMEVIEQRLDLLGQPEKQSPDQEILALVDRLAALEKPDSEQTKLVSEIRDLVVARSVLE